MDFPPDCASRFRSVRPLGAGGHGAVFAAEHVDLGRPAAVKLLKVDAEADLDLERRFLDEARITASLKHPAIVVVYDFGKGDGRPWIAYELIEGRTLREELEDGPLEPARALEAAIAIAAALECAHAANILHRDIKPDNVFALKTGGFKVADFGIAKWTREGAVATQTGVLLATPHYVSPEQIEGHSASPASDVYAVGAVLHELLTGAPPYVGANVMEILDGHLKAPPPSLRARRPDLPRELDEVVAGALAKKPGERPASAGALRAALEGCRAGVGGSGASHKRVARPGQASPTAVISRAARSSTQHVSPPARPVWPLVAAGLLVTMLGAFALVPRVAPPASTPTPRPARAVPSAAVHDLAVITTDRAAQVDFRLEPPSAVRVKLHTPDNKVLSQSREKDRWVRLRFEDLAPDREYVLDVVSAEGHLLRGLRFRTLSEPVVRTIHGVVDDLYSRHQGFDAASLATAQSYPHPKMVAAFLRTLEGSEPIPDIRTIPDHARRLRDRKVAQALIKRLPGFENYRTRAFTIEAIALARLPEARALALEGLKDDRITGNESEFFTACALALLSSGAPDASAEIIAAVDRLGGRFWIDARVPDLIIAAGTEAARDAFQRWLGRTDDYLRHLAVTGLAKLDDAPSIAALVGIARRPPDAHGSWARAVEGLSGSARPEARDGLREALVRHGVNAPLRLLWAATRQGITEVVPLLTRVLSDPGAAPRLRAQAAGCLEYLGAPHGDVALAEALQHATAPEERFAVVSALVARGHPEGFAAACEELKTLEPGPADALTFALARAKVPEGLRRLRQRIDDMSSDPNADGLVLIAMLHLLNELAPDEARPVLERLAADPKRSLRVRRGAAIELDPRRARSRTVHFVVPGACFVRAGVKLERGDTVRIEAAGSWGFKGHNTTAPHQLNQLGGKVPARLTLEWRIGPHAGQIAPDDVSVTAPRDGEIVWTPFGGEAFQNAGPLVMDESADRPDIHGSAVVIIDQPLR